MLTTTTNSAVLIPELQNLLHNAIHKKDSQAVIDFKNQRYLDSNIRPIDIDQATLIYVVNELTQLDQKNQHPFKNCDAVLLSDVASIFVRKDGQDKPKQFINLLQKYTENLELKLHDYNSPAEYVGAMQTALLILNKNYDQFTVKIKHIAEYSEKQLTGLNNNQYLRTNFLKTEPLGIAYAFYNLGYIHYFGINTVEDNEKAFEYFTKAAEYNYPPAIRYLGICYGNGYGTKQDYKKAWEYCEKAANLGEIVGFYSLGRLASKSEELENPQKAWNMFQKAAKLGNCVAQKKMGEINLAGELKTANKVTNLEGGQDTSKAIFWYKLAAEQGDDEAAKKVAEIFEQHLKPQLIELLNKLFNFIHEQRLKIADLPQSEYFKKITVILFYKPSDDKFSADELTLLNDFKSLKSSVNLKKDLRKGTISTITIDKFHENLLAYWAELLASPQHNPHRSVNTIILKTPENLLNLIESIGKICADVEKLIIDQANIDKSKATALITALEIAGENYTLKKLEFKECIIASEAYANLLTGILKHPQLSFEIHNFISIEATKIILADGLFNDDEVITAFTKIIQSHKNLQQLSFIDKNLTTDSLDKILAALANNATAMDLQFAGEVFHKINNNALEKLPETLTAISFTASFIKKNTMAKLSQNLHNFTKLTSLNFHQCIFDNADNFKELIAKIENHQQINSLNFSGSTLFIDQLQLFLQCKNITSINLSNCDFIGNYFDQFTVILQQNKSIKSLDLRGINFSQEQLNKLANSLWKTNFTLTAIKLDNANLFTKLIQRNANENLLTKIKTEQQQAYNLLEAIYQQVVSTLNSEAKTTAKQYLEQHEQQLDFPPETIYLACLQLAIASSAFNHIKPCLIGLGDGNTHIDLSKYYNDFCTKILQYAAVNATDKIEIFNLFTAKLLAYSPEEFKNNKDICDLSLNTSTTLITNLHDNIEFGFKKIDEYVEIIKDKLFDGCDIDKVKINRRISLTKESFLKKIESAEYYHEALKQLISEIFSGINIFSIKNIISTCCDIFDKALANRKLDQTSFCQLFITLILRFKEKITPQDQITFFETLKKYVADMLQISKDQNSIIVANNFYDCYLNQFKLDSIEQLNQALPILQEAIKIVPSYDNSKICNNFYWQVLEQSKRAKSVDYFKIIKLLDTIPENCTQYNVAKQTVLELIKGIFLEKLNNTRTKNLTYIQTFKISKQTLSAKNNIERFWLLEQGINACTSISDFELILNTFITKYQNIKLNPLMKELASELEKAVQELKTSCSSMRVSLNEFVLINSTTVIQQPQQIQQYPAPISTATSSSTSTYTTSTNYSVPEQQYVPDNSTHMQQLPQIPSYMLTTSNQNPSQAYNENSSSVVYQQHGLYPPISYANASMTQPVITPSTLYPLSFLTTAPQGQLYSNHISVLPTNPVLPTAPPSEPEQVISSEETHPVSSQQQVIADESESQNQNKVPIQKSPSHTSGTLFNNSSDPLSTNNFNQLMQQAPAVDQLHRLPQPTVESKNENTREKARVLDLTG